MFQIRIHGRGGQGVVTAAEVLSVAAFRSNLHAQAFPSFGSERMGAPVMAFCRISDRTIRLREPVMQPDALIIQDPTLLHQVDLFRGLSPDGYILINSGRSFHELGIEEFVRSLRPERCFTVPATELARKYVGKPLPNAALLGAFAFLTPLIGLNSLLDAIMDKFPGKIGEANCAAAKAAFDAAMAQRPGAEADEEEYVEAN